MGVEKDARVLLLLMSTAMISRESLTYSRRAGKKQKPSPQDRRSDYSRSPIDDVKGDKNGIGGIEALKKTVTAAAAAAASNLDFCEGNNRSATFLAVSEVASLTIICASRIWSKRPSSTEVRNKLGRFSAIVQ
ncbi:cyclic nucleotide gated channel 1 [Prunus dulcis]|uniref:Cyclic nucleotide gated channel 1 n=1 Tax=Prunus dulcis TaxID=3755 RepID=A0A4Y1R1D6_PRUDU|nr:cyclic nucleotide gated channel 1 [Prunus dulcis]